MMLSASDDGDEISPSSVPSQGSKLRESISFDWRLSQRRVGRNTVELTTLVRRVASLDSQPQLELISSGRPDEDVDGYEPGLNGTDKSSSWSWLRSLWARLSPYSRPSEQGTQSMSSLACALPTESHLALCAEFELISSSAPVRTPLSASAYTLVP